MLELHKVFSKSPLQLTISQGFCLSHITRAFLLSTGSLLTIPHTSRLWDLHQDLHPTRVSFHCSQDIHYGTRACLTMTQIHLFTFFIKTFFFFFMQIAQFNPILHQMHCGERAGFTPALSNNKNSKRKAQTGLS